MRMRRFSAGSMLALMMLAATLITACGPAGTTPVNTGTPTAIPGETPTPITVESTTRPALPGSSVKVVASDLERVTEPDITNADLAALASGHNDFALRLYQTLREEEGNLFYSPYSISTALAMTYAGARGETATQMAAVLGFTLDSEALHPAMNAAAQRLSAQQSLTLTVANSLWAQEDYTFLDGYLDQLALHYGAGVRLVDYIDPEAREAARQAINTWVEEETQGKIEELLKENMLTDLTRLVLANAIYFKGEWEKPFQLGTNEAPFTLLDGSTVTVPLMSRRATTPYHDGGTYQAVAMPYTGGRMQMVVILPADGAFRDVESALDAGLVQQIVDQLDITDVKLYLPRFSYEARLDLGQTLADMGMPDAFDAERADFSGMDGTTMLRLSQVAHQAFVAVDEEGTEAAAATGVVAEQESLPIEVRTDRPFIYFIHDTELDLLLFVGRVINPIAGE